MRVRLDPSNDRDYRAYVSSFRGEDAEIVDGSLTQADTVEELVVNHPNQVTEHDRLHFKLSEFTFEDVHYSQRHEEVYTAEGRGGTSEFLVRVNRIHGDSVNFSPIPFVSEVRQSTDAPILRVFGLELLLEGVVKSHGESIERNHGEYVPTKEAFGTP